MQSLLRREEEYIPCLEVEGNNILCRAKHGLKLKFLEKGAFVNLFCFMAVILENERVDENKPGSTSGFSFIRCFSLAVWVRCLPLGNYWLIFYLLSWMWSESQSLFSALLLYLHPQLMSDLIEFAFWMLLLHIKWMLSEQVSLVSSFLLTDEEQRKE